MAYSYNKATGTVEETKPAIKSASIWFGAAAIIGGIITALPELAEQIVPFLPPHIAGIVTATAGVVLILKRIYGENLPIKGTLEDEQ